MAKYDPVGTIWKKRSNPWPAIIVGVLVMLMFLSALS